MYGRVCFLAGKLEELSERGLGVRTCSASLPMWPCLLSSAAAATDGDQPSDTEALQHLLEFFSHSVFSFLVLCVEGGQMLLSSPAALRHTFICTQWIAPVLCSEVLVMVVGYCYSTGRQIWIRAHAQSRCPFLHCVVTQCIISASELVSVMYCSGLVC